MDKENVIDTICVSHRQRSIYIQCICIHTHTHNGILFSIKKERNPAISNNMDEPGGPYAKVT